MKPARTSFRMGEPRSRRHNKTLSGHSWSAGTVAGTPSLDICWLQSLLVSLLSGFSRYQHHHAGVAAGGHHQGCEREGLLLPLFFRCLTLVSFLSYLHTWAFLHTVIPHCQHSLFHGFSWRLWGEGLWGAGGVKSKKAHFADCIALLGAMPERMCFFPLSSPPFPNPNIDEILRASLNVFAQAASGQAPEDAGY